MSSLPADPCRRGSRVDGRVELDGNAQLHTVCCVQKAELEGLDIVDCGLASSKSLSFESEEFLCCV